MKVESRLENNVVLSEGKISSPSPTDIYKQDLVDMEHCTSICPECNRQCSLNIGHYSSHRCTAGHRWPL